jgi:asparagine synthase (glutamine-hydrolysing)
MVWHLEEPYGGGLPSWYVFREMSKDVKVGLTGTGGDELFGNYGKFNIYETHQLARLATGLRQRSVWAADFMAKVISPVSGLTSYLPASWRWVGRGQTLSQLPSIVNEPFGRYYYANFVHFRDVEKQDSVLRVQRGALQDTASYLQALYESSQAPDLRNGLAAVDLQTQLAEEFLFMTDRFSMAHSLEARVPFLDHTFVEQTFRIPSALRTKHGDLKYLLKKAVGDLLPPALLKVPKKGFVIPIEVWLRGRLRPLVQRLLHPERLAKQGLFHPGFYKQYVVPHLEGHASFTWQIWAVLMFQLWFTVFIERKETERPSYDFRAITT